MHTKQTVKYICEHHLASGRKWYYKQEIITDSTWRDLDSLRWSAKREVTRRTFRRAMDAGYPCEIRFLRNPLAQIVEFPLERAMAGRREEGKNGIVKLFRKLGPS